MAERMRAAALARSRYEATGEVDYAPAVGAGDPHAAMPFDIDFYQDPQRGAVPAWPNQFAVIDWPGWLTYDAISLAAHIRQPTLVVHSEQGAIPAGAHQFADTLTAARRIEWTDGTQFYYYDGDAHVDHAVDLAAAHFSEHLR